MNIPYIMKRCSKCGRWLVASKVNFYKQKGGKYGLGSICKECRAKYNKQHCKVKEKEKSLNTKLTRAKDSYRKVGDKWLLVKKCTCCGKWLVTNKNNFYKDKKSKYGLQSQCKECIDKKNKQYCQSNKEKIAKISKRWDQTPQGRASRLNRSNRRRHKKEAQGTGVTGEQWLEMMQYFDWRCAYSGKRLTDKTRSGDHIVSIDAGGDDMVWNMVPMLRNLNSSKQAKDMLEWYKQQSFYSEARLAKIYEWQEYARKKWKIS